MEDRRCSEMEAESIIYNLFLQLQRNTEPYMILQAGFLSFL